VRGDDSNQTRGSVLNSPSGVTAGRVASRLALSSGWSEWAVKSDLPSSLPCPRFPQNAAPHRFGRSQAACLPACLLRRRNATQHAAVAGF